MDGFIVVPHEARYWTLEARIEHAKAPVPNINGNRALYLTCNPVRITWEMAPSEASVLLVRCKAQLQAPCLQNMWAYRESLPYNPSSPVVRMNHN
jgi:hypothetical protein